MGGPDAPPRDAPWLPIAMTAKTLYDAATTVEFAREGWQENPAFRAYCQTANLAYSPQVAFAPPGAVRTARRLLCRGGPA